ncbi:MAG: haloacid dehalogenase type II [Alphaproteobacteria bacterium]|nr:haloacid dehalogenase type II [Alphaproteobacteria bacterium]
MKLTGFKVLSFDCYGTLIDWETGLWSSLQPLLERTRIDRESALATFGEVESEHEHEAPTLPYRDILARVHAKLAGRWKLKSTDTMDKAFGVSVGAWPPFPDTVEALAYLKRHYKLVILSNVDRENFAATNKSLAVEFDAICTAEDIGSYKPDPKNFAYLLKAIEDLGHSKADLLHTAQSLYHDHAPAERASIARCWINRRGDKAKGSGATKAVAAIPKLDFEFPTLYAMAQAHRAEAS